MATEVSDDRLVFQLEADESFQLEAIGEGFAALARQYERTAVEQTGVQVPAKLLITDVRTGSIWFEVALPAAAIYAQVHTAIDHAVVLDAFFTRVGDVVSYLSGKSGRPHRFGREDAEDFNSFLKTVSGKRGSSLKIRRAKYKRKGRGREVLAEFEFDAADLSLAGHRLAGELGGPLEDEPSVVRRHVLERSVPFIWYRTDRDRGKSRGTTSDRGVIAKVTEKPLPVFFPSEADELKQRMTKIDKNPFAAVYLVDVLVEYDDAGEPVTYTITEIHQTISG